MMSLSYKKFCCIALGGLLAVMAIVGVTNYVVDPYNRFGNNRLGIYLLSGEKHTKIGLARKYDPTKGGYILMGDSRGAHTHISDLGVPNSVNCSYGGGAAAEHYYFIQKHVPEGSRILLGIPLGRTGGAIENNFFKKEESYGETLSQFLLSLKSFEFSLTTVARSLTGREKRLFVDGSVNPYKWVKQYEQDAPEQRQYELETMIDGFLKTMDASEEHMVYYHRLKEILETKNISAHIYLYPVHEEILEGVRGTEAYAVSQAWKHKLTAIFPNLVDLSESQYSGKEHYANLDFIHFYSASGISLLKEAVLK